MTIRTVMQKTILPITEGYRKEQVTINQVPKITVTTIETIAPTISTIARMITTGIKEITNTIMEEVMTVEIVAAEVAIRS